MDISLGLTTQSRAMISPDAALRLAVEAATLSQPQRVPLTDACGLRLAEDIFADRDYPPFPRAMMDGFAVRGADAGSRVLVAGQIPAGRASDTEIMRGQCWEIMTGAPCPPSTEAVVPKEQVRRDGGYAVLPEMVSPGQHIAPQGSECPAGRLVLCAGTIVTPLAIAAMASIGLESVRVVPRPRVAVITTGGELTSPGRQPQPGQIRDSNGPMLVAMARDLGIEQPPHLHREDSSEAILDALKQMADRDIVLLSGGVSVGTYDLVPEALNRYGATTIFHKVRQKPGKPLLLACKDAQLIFGLPGNPLGCHLGFHRYVSAAIRQMEGKSPVPEPIHGELLQPVDRNGERTYFVAGRAEYVPSRERPWRISPVPGVSSADVFASYEANCYIEVPPGHAPVRVGEILPFTWIGGAPWPN